MSDKESEGTFRMSEMREAYGKFVRGEPLTDKERLLAEARHQAVKVSLSPVDYGDDGCAAFPYEIGEIYNVVTDRLEGVMRLVAASEKELVFMLQDQEIIVGRHWIKQAYKEVECER